MTDNSSEVQSTSNFIDPIETSDEIETHLQELLKLQREIDELRTLEIKNSLNNIAPHEKKICLEKQPLFEKREELIGKIPKFWAVSLRNCLTQSGLFDENEVACFDFLSRMSVEHIQGAETLWTGLKVHFYFEENNPIIENKVVFKVIRSDFEDRQTTTTPIKCKLEPSCEGSTQETTNQEHLSVFDWLEDNDELFSTKFLYILELWENPLQFYTLYGDVPEIGSNDDIKRALEELKLYQQRIDELNKSLNENIMGVVTHIGDEYESSNRILFDKRKEIINKIPNFWATALSRDSKLLKIMSKEDIEFLKYITNVDVEHKFVAGKVKSSITVHIYLSEHNPYIENEVLSKSFFIDNDDERMCKGTTIVWRKDVEHSQEHEVKTGNGQNTNDPKLINWFNEDVENCYNSFVLFRILELWEDPLQYVLDLEDVIEELAEIEGVQAISNL